MAQDIHAAGGKSWVIKKWRLSAMISALMVAYGPTPRNIPPKFSKIRALMGCVPPGRRRLDACLADARSVAFSIFTV